jgi:putative ATP-binding cassette transporter
VNLLTTFTRFAPDKIFIAIILGVVAGICYSALIPIVMMGIAPSDPAFITSEDNIEFVFNFKVSNYDIAILYTLLCLGIFTMRVSSEILLVRVSGQVAKEIRTMFYKQIALAPYETIEKIGPSKFITALNVDVPRIVGGGHALPRLLVNSLTLTGMLVFLFYLNPDIFELLMWAILISVIIYQMPLVFAKSIFQRSRDVNDNLQDGVKGLIYGAKELKLDSHKSKYYFDQVLLDSETKMVDAEIKSQTVMKVTTSFGDLITFIVIGCVSFIFLNYQAIRQDELVGVVMTLLYIGGPISMLLSMIPQLTIAAVSLKKFKDLKREVEIENASIELSVVPEWQTLKFEGVEYNYASNSNEKGFKIGPVSFAIKKGEITFIVGANGSGKSTLSKLLSLHYAPSSGDILFGDHSVTKQKLNSYRLQIGAISTDFYLFDRILADLDYDHAKQAENYLKKLHLSDKVQLTDGEFSTLALSDGQKKRLALIVSLIEDKQLYIFDEWAADQDPIFKGIFYNKILADLKARGKAVIIISHDDRYFHVADHMLVMENGKLMECRDHMQMGNIVESFYLVNPSSMAKTANPDYE